MKKKWAFLLSITLIIIMTASLAEGFLPPLNELFDTEMPNMENALKRYADKNETLPDGSFQMIFFNTGRSEYTACSEYLGKSDCNVLETIRIGKTLNAVIEKGGRTFSFNYDAEQETIKVIYPIRTFAEEYIASIQVGDIIKFGVYPQTKEGTDKTPIEWLVLATDGQKALVLSRYGLDSQPYNDGFASVTWQTCSLRNWLNNEFLNTAFNTIEKKAILVSMIDNSKSQGNDKWSATGGYDTEDKIFLLSYKEAISYINISKKNDNNNISCVVPTSYSIERGAYISNRNRIDGLKTGWWWLRSPGIQQNDAAGINPVGSPLSSRVNDIHGSVRPALWINQELLLSYDQDSRNFYNEYCEANEYDITTQKAKKALFSNLMIDEYIYFGKYPQTGSGKDFTPIEWEVIDIDETKALLLSRYGLDVMPYEENKPTATWETCTLRNWLNTYFINTAFSEDEQETILLTYLDNSESQGNNTYGGLNTNDKVFLLSYFEVNKYLDVKENYKENKKSRVSPTPYAIEKGAYTNEKNQTIDGLASGWWWLRSPSGNLYNASSVRSDGSFRKTDINENKQVIRPALWICLSSDN